MTNTLTDLSSISIQHYTAAARREAAIDRLYSDALAQGQAMEEAGIDIDEFAAQFYDEAYERTRAERWSSLTTEEQDAVIEASEEEAGLRYDAAQGRVA